jgi:MoaA/NifB/PqqE/SkfB family radical SAM enzyme
MFFGAFQKAVATLRFLVSKGKKPIITTVFMDGTPYEMLEDLALLARDLKSKISVNVLSNSHENSGGGNDCRLHSQYISVVQKLKAEFEDVFIDPEPFLSIIKLGGLDIFGCRAMDVAIAIKPDGSVCMPCTRFSKKQLEGNLKTIFYGKDAEELRTLQGKDPNCEGCAMRCMSSASGLLTLKGQVSTFNTYARSII